MADNPEDGELRFTHALGTAVVHVWAELPQEVQEKLFAHAVVAGHRTERDESLREELARYLHDRHERTQAAQADDDSHARIFPALMRDAPAACSGRPKPSRAEKRRAST
jgi:hypothetical protein